MERNYKIVSFYTYCQTCKYKDNSDDDTPCDECLKVPARLGTTKPERWKSK